MTKNKYRKIVLSTLVLILVFPMMTIMVTADGWHPSAEYLHLYEPAQKAVIYWDGNTEIMILSSAVRSENLTDIAWVVPIISTTKPNVTSGNMSLFEELVDFIGGSYWWNRYFHKIGGEYKDGNISIIEISEVDIYDVIILKATNASDLIDWLVENNLLVPEEAHEVIERYVQMDNCYFVINKIDLENRFKDIIEQLKNGIIPDNLEEYEQVIEDLRRGMATPLMFEFTPPELYYPLVISSLNQGQGKIEVYVIAEKPVADLNAVMEVDKCKKITEELKEKLQVFIPVEKAEYVTRLTFNGMLEDLADDAVFDFFMVSNQNNPVFLYIPTALENLASKSLIDVLTFDPEEGLLELQYRTDKTGPWMVAERSDMAYIYGNWYYLIDYDFPVYETSGALWTIEIDAANLTDGNHTLELRVLHKKNEILFYTPIYTQNFSTITENYSQSNLSTDTQNSNLLAVLISGLVVVSIATVAVISKKTNFAK